MERVQTQFLICRTCGCSFGSVGLFLSMMDAFGMLGQSWDHVGLLLGHFGLCWHHTGLMVMHFGIFWGLCWPELGPYWANLGPFWAMLGHSGPHWHHFGLMLSHFRIFCWPLSWTWAFLRRWIFVHARRRLQKNTVNTKKNTIIGLRCKCVWCYFVFAFFLLSACCT